MKASTVLAAVVAAFAASCAAHPALRGQDSDPRDPGALLSRGDRPTPALPAPAAPSLRRQDLEQDGEATAPRGGGRRGAEKAPGAPALQADRPLAALPELAAPSLGVQVLEQDGEATAPRGGGRRAFEEAPGAPTLQADRPLAVLPELAAPSLGVQVLEQDGEATAPRGGGRRAFEEAPGAPDGQRQVALLARGGQVLDQSPRARELQEECGGMVPSALDGEFCGYCLDSNDEFYEGILFYDVPDHEDCLARCPINDKFVGYDYTPVRNLCICRYEDGTVTRDSCPAGYNRSNCRTSISWIGEGPVTGGDGDSQVACRAKRVCGGDVLSSSYEACGQCADRLGRFYEGIFFSNVPDHEDCFARCPVSDKFVGYEYIRWDPTHVIEDFCICRYEDGTVVRDYCPHGICRNEDGTVTGNSCPDSYDGTSCMASSSGSGEGPVVYGSGRREIACRAKLFTTGAAFGAAFAGQTYNTTQFREWVTDTVPELPMESIKNPSALVRLATSWRRNYTEMFLAEQNVPDVSFWDVSKGTEFAKMFEGTYGAGFDQNIGAWDVSRGTEFHDMFRDSQAFNQNIGAWDVSKGKQFNGMFENTRGPYNDGSPIPSAFDQNIGSWSVARGTDFNRMFRNANSFDQDLSGWRISVKNYDYVDMMFTGSGMSHYLRCPCVEIRSWSDFRFRFCPGLALRHSNSVC